MLISGIVNETTESHTGPKARRIAFCGEPRTLNPVCRVDVQTVPGCLADSLFSCVVVYRVRLLRIQPQLSTSRSESGAEILQGPNLTLVHC